MTDTKLITDPGLIVVSGEPRSGTSMMMQTLKILGLPVLGKEYPGEEQLLKIIAAETDTAKKQRLQSRIDLMKQMNPKGFYELPGPVMKGIKQWDASYQRKVVKIITNGLFEHINSRQKQLGTPENFIDKIIFCLRDPRSIAMSQTDIGPNPVEEIRDNDWIIRKQPPTPTRFVFAIGAFINWLGSHQDFWTKIKVVDFDDMITKPPISDICSHLSINPNKALIDAAIANISPGLKRSAAIEEWPTSLQRQGIIADELYSALKLGDLDKLAALNIQIKSLAGDLALENIRWTDEDTWLNVNPVLHRDLESKPVLKEKAALHSSIRPNNCRFFGRSDKTYTIKRPVDLGDLTRKYIHCERDNVDCTIEKCLQCWLVGSIVEDVRRGAEMEAQKDA